MSNFIPVHYRPYDDEPAACGSQTGKQTNVADDVTCEDCKYELR